MYIIFSWSSIEEFQGSSCRPSNNNSSSFFSLGNIPPYPKLSSADNAILTAWIASTLSLCVLGVFSNITVLITTWPKGERKNVLNLQIFHFITINLLLCMFGTPTAVFLVLAKHHGLPVPPTLCNFTHPPTVVLTALINWCDAGLSANRVIALYFPLKYKNWNSKFFGLAMIAGSWVICLSTVFPIALGVEGSKMLSAPLGQCTVKAPSGIFGKFSTPLVAYIPYAITGVGAVLILCKTVALLRDRRRIFQISGLDAGRRDGVLKRRLNLARMLLLNFLWAAVCSAPAYVIVVNFPHLFATSPVSALWVWTCAVCQYCFTPVWKCQRMEIIANLWYKWLTFCSYSWAFFFCFLTAVGVTTFQYGFPAETCPTPPGSVQCIAWWHTS